MRYRIAITITKNDVQGRALSLMANGNVVAFDDEPRANTVANDFVSVANQLLARSTRAFKSYGVVALIDEQEGKIINTWHLGG